jgi:hypothetical protein
MLEKIVRALDRNKVQYTLIGGYAVALHGAPRMTMDIDFLTHLTEQNLSKVVEVLESMGLYSRLPITAKDVAHFRKEYIERRNLIAWSFVNPKNPMEAVDILLNYDVSDVASVTKKIGNLKVSVISLKDLIKLKTEAGRPQDLEDIRALKEIQKNEK